MGKKIIPPHDPQRLQRIMDEKQRMIGVSKDDLDRQSQEKKSRQQLETIETKNADARLLEVCEQVEILQEEVCKARQTASRRLADALQQQVQDKRHRDAIMKEEYRNKMSEEYHKQFGTSHR